jgi:hypothetical protein
VRWPIHNSKRVAGILSIFLSGIIFLAWLKKLQFGRISNAGMGRSTYFGRVLYVKIVCEEGLSWL